MLPRATPRPPAPFRGWRLPFDEKEFKKDTDRELFSTRASACKSVMEWWFHATTPPLPRHFAVSSQPCGATPHSPCGTVRATGGGGRVVRAESLAFALK